MARRFAPATIQLAALGLVGLFCALKLPLDLFIISPLQQIKTTSIARTPERSYCTQFEGTAREICAQACA
jgi:hypothetical protein